MVRTLIAAFGLATVSYGAIIYDSGLDALAAGDPTQLGRLSRNGVISDWSTVKTYPGEINTTISYHYKTYVIPILSFPFIQISIDDVSGSALTFASAYLNSYNSANKSLNYLGDPGSSGNFFGTDPQAFQVYVPLNYNLVLVVNDTSPTNVGVGKPYTLLVEGFSDTNFDEVPAPEPAQWALDGLGLTSIALFSALLRKEATRCV